MTLSLQLFGSITLERDGQSLPRPRIRKDYWLLALLALRSDRDTERTFLAGAFWPDIDESQARFYLRRSLNELRQILGPDACRLASPTPRTLRLDASGMHIDLLEFDAALKREDAPSLEAAVALYRGDLLEGCDELWVIPEREARRNAYIEALHQLGRRRQAADPAAALTYLRQAVAADPLNEPVQRSLLEALAAGKDFAGAQQAYREFRLLLREQLQSDPSPETTQLYQRVRAEARRAASEAPRHRGASGVEAPSIDAVSPAREAPPTNLPAALSSFVGRETEIGDVIALLGKTRLLTLTGIGGVGKTRLALQAAGEVCEEYRDGVWLVELASLADAGLVPQAAAAILKVREQPGQSITEALIDHLRSRRMLLLLDNCEHLLSACIQLADELLRHCPALKILATSREGLGVVGEQLYLVPSLSVPAPERTVVLEALGRYEAVRLFIERAGSGKADFAMTDVNARAIATVCYRLDGIPLAVELAAARVRSLSLDEINTRLDDRFRLLTDGSKSALPRQQTLRALIDWSYELLTTHEKLLFTRLSIFTGGWTIEAAERVCGSVEASGGPRSEEMLDLLTRLVDKSLVTPQTEGRITRYRFLETVRQYALQRLIESGEREEARARHRDYFLELAERADPHLSGPDQAQWLSILETDYDNLRQALTYSLEEPNGGASAYRMALALQLFWAARGYEGEGRQYFSAVIARCSGPEYAQYRARALNGASTLAYMQGDFEVARTLTEESLAIKRELDDRAGISNSLMTLGIVAYCQGDYATARARFGECLALKRELNDRPGIAGALNNLGNIFREQEDSIIAADMYTESLAIERELGDRRSIAGLLINLGIVAQHQGDYAAARRLFQESLETFQELRDRRGIATVLMNLSDLLSLQDDLATADALYQETLTLWRDLGNQRGVADTLNRLGTIARRCGEYAKACALQVQSLTIQREIVNRVGVAESLESIACLAYDEGRFQLAARLWGAATTLRSEIDFSRSPQEIKEYDRQLHLARAAYGADLFDASFAEGLVFSQDQAVSLALAEIYPQADISAIAYALTSFQTEI